MKEHHTLASPSNFLKSQKDRPVAKLLIVDDEPSICWGFRRLGEQLCHDVFTAPSAEQGLTLARQHRPDAIVLDVRLPGMDGLTAVEQFREVLGSVPIVVMTAHGDLRTAVQAVRQGVSEYLIKPFDAQRAQQVLERALAAPCPHTPSHVTAVDGFVGQTPAMQEAFHQIALASHSDACVLLQGESGTGKELAARAIHKHSRRAGHPFVVINVAALSPALAESELFGHVRGAFTGAAQPRTGLLKQADGGTLFLDEVADIPIAIQVKLLRALEQGEVTPVGANEPEKTDFRIISATHQDLLTRVQEGLFRHDLYFRLAAFRILLPPLRERRADIVALCDYFLAQLACSQGVARQLSETAQQELVRRPWHGNVRELRNAIEHAAIVSHGGLIQPEHLPRSAPAGVVPDHAGSADVESQIQALLAQWTQTQLQQGSLPTALYEQLLALVEPPVLRTVVESQAGQLVASARILGLHRTTLRKKLDQQGSIDDGNGGGDA